MQHITLDLNAAMALATPEWSELNTRFRKLNHEDSESQRTLIGMVRELVEDLCSPDSHGLLHLVEDKTTPVHLFADFHCDEYGEITNDHHLSLSVMIGGAPLIMDAGISDIRDLPLPDDCTELDAVVVLAAVVDYVNDLIRRAVETFTGPTPPVSQPAPITPLEQRVVSVDGVRDEADLNPALSPAQRSKLRAASDTDISAAITASWPLIQERFYEIHDELQSAALTHLLD